MKSFLCFLTSLLLCFTSAWAKQPDKVLPMPFQELHLLSCTTTLRQSNPLYLGVTAVPRKGWTLGKATLTATNSANIPIQVLSPFQQPYTTQTTLPISPFLAGKSVSSLTVFITGQWNACSDSGCINVPINLQKTLEKGMDFITPQCNNITVALGLTPIPMHATKIKGWAIQQGDSALITLDLEKTPKSALIYDQNKQPLSVDISLNNKRLQFQMPATNKVQFYLQTYHHIYEIDLPLLPAGTSVPPAPLSWWDYLNALIGLCILSAFPIFWARSKEQTQKQFQKEAMKTAVLTLGMGVITICGLWLIPHLNICQIPFSKNITLILMALGLLIIPAHPVLAIIFSLIAPKPYLSFLSAEHLLTTSLLILMATVITAGTFLVQYRYAKPIYKTLHHKKTESTIWWCARIPWILLMIYLVVYL